MAKQQQYRKHFYSFVDRTANVDKTSKDGNLVFNDLWKEITNELCPIIVLT